jgi:hypothetical protein
MYSVSLRMFLGAVAGALSMLLFHQTTLQVFYWCGLAREPGFRLAIVPPFGVPQVVSACFWAALIAAVYGVVRRRSGTHRLLSGLVLGMIGMALVWFVVLPLKGQPVAFNFQPMQIVRSATASALWGIGVGILFPLLLPKRFGSKRWTGRSLHA